MTKHDASGSASDRQADAQLLNIEAWADLFADALAKELGYVIAEVLLTDARSIAYGLLEHVEKDSRALCLEWRLERKDRLHDPLNTTK